jgi:hypothetical protein
MMLKQTGLVGIYPLMVLTKDGKRPEVVEEQGVCLFQDYISRLGKARMVQCGPERYRSTLKRMDTWDERPL